MTHGTMTPRKIGTRVIALALLAGTMLLPGQSHAQEWIRNDMTYYSIGGGQTLGGPASYRRHATIGGDASLSLGYSCGQFDLTSNLSSMFSRFAGSLDSAVNSLVYAAQGAVASLPLYLLRQANPGLAQMLETNLLRYEEEYRLGIKNCREAEREILQGKNPYYDWVSFGQADTWRQGARRGRTVDQIGEDVMDRHGCVTWVDGIRYFCDENDTRQIPVYEDIVRAGYRQLNEEPDAGVPNPTRGTERDRNGPVPSRMSRVWPEEDDAVEEVLELTGETLIGNARQTPPSGRPPRGASARIHEETAEIAQDLRDAITLSDQQTLRRRDLEDLGTPGLVITPSLIEALRSLNEELQVAAINRIAGEIALLRAMERVNLARRVLLVGLSLPAIAVSPARDVIRKEGLPLLEAEARLLRDEYDLRGRVASSTAQSLLAHDLVRRGRPVRGSGGTSPLPFIDGGQQQ